MEAIEYILRWVGWLSAFVIVASGLMITYHAISKITAQDEGHIAECNKKIKYTLYGGAIACSIAGFIRLIEGYF